MRASRSTAWPTSSTSCCAGGARRCSRTGWRGTEMPQKLDYLRETASQTAGPYVHIGLAPGAAGFQIFENELGQDIAGPHAAGERIRVEGVVIDGTGAPVKDVLIE